MRNAERAALHAYHRVDRSNKAARDRELGGTIKPIVRIGS
jgi:hypothetical protein